LTFGRLVPLIALGTLLAAAGCGQKDASQAPPAAKDRDALAKQLSAMKPEERAAYMQQHPEAMSKLSGQGGGPDSNP